MANEKSFRVAVIGGTFDPIHYGHLLAAERTREELGLDCVYFIPSGTPPHKKYDGMASAFHRYNMASIAVETNPFFKILDIEIKREGYSYTIDTMEQLRGMMPSACSMYFIIGSDNMTDIPNWKNAEELAAKTEFAVVTRPGDWQEGLEQNARELRERGFGITLVRTPLVSVNSTDIRERIKDGRSIRYMVPQGVEKYIYDNNLYKQ